MVGAVVSLRPAVPRAPVPLALLYAAGGYWLATWLVIIALFAASSLIRPPLSSHYGEAIRFVAAAAAVAVGLRSGGVRAVGALGALFAAWAVLQSWEPLQRCVVLASPGPCENPVVLIPRRLPDLAGGVAGLPLAFALRAGSGTSALLIAAGLLGIVEPLFAAVFAVVVSVARPTGVLAYQWYVAAIVSRALAAAAAGAIIGRGSRPARRSLVLLEALLLIPWAAGPLRQWWQDMRDLQAFGMHISLPMVLQTQWQTFTPAAYAVLLLLGFLAVRVLRRS